VQQRVSCSIARQGKVQWIDGTQKIVGFNVILRDRVKSNRWSTVVSTDRVERSAEDSRSQQVVVPIDRVQRSVEDNR
jgi:hypothetical protein